MRKKSQLWAYVIGFIIAAAIVAKLKEFVNGPNDSSNANNSMTKILSVPMANTEIEEFVFNLYFVGLMDLVLPDEIYQKLDDILCRIFGDNWYNYN